MRTLPLVIASLFIVSALAVSPITGVAQDDAAETDEIVEVAQITNWGIGDYWKWQQVPTAQSKSKTAGDIYQKVRGQELVSMELYDEEKHEDWMKRHMSWVVTLMANKTANSAYGPAAIQLHQDRYYRVDDLGLAKMDSETRYTFVDTPAADTGSHSTQENFPPRLSYVFPMALDDKWRVRSWPLKVDHTCEQEQEALGDDPESAQRPCKSTTNRLNDYTVLREEPLKITIDGTIQEFDTIVILVEDLFRWDDAEHPTEVRYDIVWYSPEVCNYVKKESYKADGTKLYIETLTDYRCSARETANPSYNQYARENLSHMRWHGELFKHEDLMKARQQLLEQAGHGGGGGPGGGVFGNLENTPAPSWMLAMSMLVGLALLAARKRRD